MQQGAFQRIATGTVFFVLTIAIATIGYIWFGWTPLEAIYMVTITIFGVGYGEVRPLQSPNEKIFTILVIIAGTSSAIYMVGGFVQMVTEGEITRALDVQRKARTIASLENHCILCGFGRMGEVLAAQLKEAGEVFVIVESDPERIALAEASEYLVQPGSATDEASLHAVAIERARVLATVLPNDATNVFVTLTARELNRDLTILARGELPSTEKKLRLAGADRVVLPETISGLRMAHLITRPTALDFLGQQEERSYLNELLAQIDVQLDELDVPQGSPLVGKTVKELEVRGKGGFIVVALRRADGRVETQPRQSLVLSGGDTAIVLGHRGDLPTFARHYALEQQMRYRGSRI